MSEPATREQRSIKVIPTILPRLEMNLWCQDADLKTMYEETMFRVCLKLCLRMLC